MVELFGLFTHGAINIAADAVTAPTRIVTDPTAAEKSVDTAATTVTLDNDLPVAAISLDRGRHCEERSDEATQRS